MTRKCAYLKIVSINIVVTAYTTLISLSVAFAAGLSYDDARHLLLRTEFAAPHERILSFEGLSRTQAARKILRDRRTTPLTPLPDWFDTVDRPPERDLTDRLLKKKTDRNAGAEPALNSANTGKNCRYGGGRKFY